MELRVLSAGVNRIIGSRIRRVMSAKKCGYRQSLKANTILHGSQLPFRYWFAAIHLITSTKKRFSAKEVQRQVGHKFYDPIWAMMHKIRSAMGNRDSQYNLSGIIELDEGFFSTEVSENEKNKPLKRGRGSQKKTKVLVMAESVPVAENESKKDGNKHRKVNHIKMFVNDDLRSETIDNKVISNIERTAIIDSDDSTSYTNFRKLVSEHCPQNYSDEFCYKFNRRYFGESQFERVLVASVSYKNQFRDHIR